MIRAPTDPFWGNKMGRSGGEEPIRLQGRVKVNRQIIVFPQFYGNYDSVPDPLNPDGAYFDNQTRPEPAVGA